MWNPEKREEKSDVALDDFYKYKIYVKFWRVKALTIMKCGGMMPHVKQRGCETIHSLFFGFTVFFYRGSVSYGIWRSKDASFY